jgi:hypothetical protein
VIVQVAARRRASPAALEDGAIISLTVVLPLLPATPTMGYGELRAPGGGDLGQRRCVSRTTICGSGSVDARVDHRARGAGGSAAATKSLALKRGPRRRDEQLARLERARVGGHAV